MGKNKSKEKSRKTNEPNEKDNPYLVSASAFLEQLIKIIYWERYSAPGQANMVCSFLLFLIIIFYILSSGIVAITRIAASVFNSDLTKDTGDNIVVLLLIFISAFAACLLVIWITRQELERTKQDDAKKNNK